MPANPERIRIGVLTFDTRAAQNFEARHVRQVQIKEEDVVVVDLAEIDAFFAEIGRVDVKALGFRHQLDRLRGGAIVFNQQYAHASPFFAARAQGRRAAATPGQTPGDLRDSNHYGNVVNEI